MMCFVCQLSDQEMTVLEAEGLVDQGLVVELMWLNIELIHLLPGHMKEGLCILRWFRLDST